MEHPQDSQKRHLLLGTVSFTVCFAAWGLDQCLRPAFSPTVSPLSDPNRLSGRGPSSAGCAGSHSDRNAGGPLWRPRRFHSSACSSSPCRWPWFRPPPATGICSSWPSFSEWRGPHLLLALVTSPAGFPWRARAARSACTAWETLASRPRCSSGRWSLPRTDFAPSIGECQSSCWSGQVCSSSLLETLPRLLVPRVSRRCSAYSHANLWRGHWRHSIF